MTLKVRFGCKRKLVLDVGTIKGLLDKTVYLVRKHGWASEEIVEELELARQHVVKALELLTQAEVVRGG